MIGPVIELAEGTGNLPASASRHSAMLCGRPCGKTVSPQSRASSHFLSYGWPDVVENSSR